MMLAWPTGHSYAVKWMLNHRMFNKLQTTMFCLSKRCPPFTRLSSFTQITKATLALQKCTMPYMLSLHVEINAIKKFQEDSTQHSWKMVKVCVSCLYIGCHDYLLTCWLGFCVAQIRFIFTPPQNAIKDLLPDVNPPTHLAYIELFQHFTPAPDADHGMYKVSESLNPAGERLAPILLVDEIHQSVHLYLKFGPVAPHNWTSSNVLEPCTQFYTNPWTDRHAYIMFS